MKSQFPLMCLLTVFALAIGCNYEPTSTFSVDASLLDVSVSSTSFETTTHQIPQTFHRQQIDLSISESDVASKSATVDATGKELTQVKRDISATELALAAAIQRQSSTLARLKNLRTKIVRIADDISVAEEQLTTRKQIYSAFYRASDDQKIAARTSVASAVEQRYEQTVAQVKLARKQRNELRARIGARPEDQSEAQLESLRTRQAREHARQTFVASIRKETSAIDAEAELLASRCASARRRLVNLREERKSVEQLINTKREELIALRGTIASLPNKLSQLREDRDRLVALKIEQAKALQVARAKLRKKKEFLAAQRRRKEFEQQVVSTPVAVPRVVPRRTCHASTQINTRNNLSRPSTSRRYSRPTGGYYNYHYRPPVGNHYVHGYIRGDGTYVSGHRRTNADDSFWNNWSSYSNVNPYNGRIGTKLPSYNYGGGSTYVRGYLRSDGTYVSGHYRRN